MSRATSRELERSGAVQTDFVDIEKRYTRKDGSILWVRVTTALVREGNATPERSVEFLRDISTRKKSGGRIAAATDATRSGHHRFAGGLARVRRGQAISRTTIAPRPTSTAYRHSILRHKVHRIRIRLAAEVYLADGVTPVSEADHPLTRALRGETINNLELVIVPRAAIATHHTVQRSPTDRTGRPASRRRSGDPGHDRTQTCRSRTRARPQAIDDCVTPGGNGRNRHQRSAQRRQYPEQRQYLAEPGGRACQTVQRAGLCRVVNLLQEKGELVGAFITPTSVASEYRRILPPWVSNW